MTVAVAGTLVALTDAKVVCALSEAEDSDPPCLTAGILNADGSVSSRGNIAVVEMEASGLLSSRKNVDIAVKALLVVNLNQEVVATVGDVAVVVPGVTLDVT
jgi:hypothetical protein